MPFVPERTAVVGATGPVGIFLVRELVGRGWGVRVVSRSRERLERAFAGLGVEVAVADALDGEAVRRAVAGCALVVDCVGLPADRMKDHAVVAGHVAEAARAAGARALLVSSYWSYLPARGEVIDETHPREGGNRYARTRRAAEDVLLAAGAAVVHLPDFFGPHVHTSTVQRALEQAARDQRIDWVGSADVERETGFVPDLGRLIADVAEREEAYGTRWALPGAGPLSGRRLAELAGAHVGRRVAVRGAPVWLLRLLAPFDAELRSFLPMAPHYAAPVRYDTAKLQALLGPAAGTPFEEAVPATLDWIASRRG